ncbi:MAG: LPS-assembly protein LptD, partial [Alphaproteobacteria bacterium]
NLYHSRKYKPIQGIDGGFTAHYTNLNRAQGLSYQRIVAENELKHKLVSDYGIIFTNRVALRGDIYQYNMERVVAQSSYISHFNPGNGYTGRFLPEYITEASYPLINRMENSTVIISPMIQGVVSPKLKKLKHIDNEDGQSPEISYSNLFSYNKFKGYDLVESGHRINYGIKGNIQSEYFQNLGFVFGQSLRAQKDTNFNEMSGLDGYQSDYVSKLFIEPTKSWYIHNESRIDNRNPKLNRNELFASYSDNHFVASLLHFYLGHNLIDSLNANKYRQEIIPSLSYRFYKEWWIRGEFHRKIGKKRSEISTPMISSGLSLYNNNECLETMIRVTRDYTHLKDLRPSTTYKIDINVPVF